MAKTDTTITAIEYTPRVRNRFRTNGHSTNGSPSGLRARSRFLKSASGTVSSSILCGGQHGRLSWLSTAYEPERQPRALERLLALLDHYDKKHFEARRKSFNFSAPDVCAAELVAWRWQLVGSSVFLADRRARRQVCALKLRTNGVTGDARDQLGLIHDSATMEEAA